MTLEINDEATLREAVGVLEHPSVVATLADLIGRPIEGGLRKLPSRAQQAISKATEKALTAAVHLAVTTMKAGSGGMAANRWHKVAVSLTGAAGGAGGAAALPFELPISTAIILRSIADIARAEGEDVSAIETRMACLEVLALGSRSSEDDAAETGYFATRAALAKAVAEAGRYLGQKGAVKTAAPPLARLIAKIAARFSPAVAEKVAAQAVPVIGALGGAAVNLAFIDHFQNVARGHFIIRRLERKYGPEAVQREYERIRKGE